MNGWDDVFSAEYDGEAGPYALHHDLQFGGMMVAADLSEFLAHGFCTGDSVDIRFSNGYTLKNVPYYSGFYAPTGAPLLCTYRGYGFLVLCLNNGEDLFMRAGLSDSSTVTLSLHEKAAFRITEEVMNMVYSNRRADYDSDAAFANFRQISAGQLKPGLLYRAASPSVNTYCRASFADRLSEKAGIRAVINLADDEFEIRDSYLDPALDAPYWKSIYENGKICPLNMSFNFRSELFIQLTARAMRFILAEDGPFLIHCTEGKDRTGFFCLLLGLLSGATRYELEADYMESYKNYYGITAQKDPDRYDAVLKLRFFDMLLYLANGSRFDEIRMPGLIRGANRYLIRGGMTQEEISALKKKLTES